MVKSPLLTKAALPLPASPTQLPQFPQESRSFPQSQRFVLFCFPFCLNATSPLLAPFRVMTASSLAPISDVTSWASLLNFQAGQVTIPASWSIALDNTYQKSHLILFVCLMPLLQGCCVVHLQGMLLALRSVPWRPLELCSAEPYCLPGQKGNFTRTGSIAQICPSHCMSPMASAV